MTLDVDKSMPMIHFLHRMGSTLTLLQGLTLPIISYFDVRALIGVARCFDGPD
jgi:hypothetical protein